MIPAQDQALIRRGSLSIHLSSIPEQAARMSARRREEIILAICAAVHKVMTAAEIEETTRSPDDAISASPDLMGLGLGLWKCVQVANGDLSYVLVHSDLHFEFFDNGFDGDDPTSPKPPSHRGPPSATPSEFIRSVDRTLNGDRSFGGRILNRIEHVSIRVVDIVYERLASAVSIGAAYLSYPFIVGLSCAFSFASYWEILLTGRSDSARNKSYLDQLKQRARHIEILVEALGGIRDAHSRNEEIAWPGTSHLGELLAGKYDCLIVDHTTVRALEDATIKLVLLAPGIHLDLSAAAARSLFGIAGEIAGSQLESLLAEDLHELAYSPIECQLLHSVVYRRARPVTKSYESGELRSEKHFYSAAGMSETIYGNDPNGPWISQISIIDGQHRLTGAGGSILGTNFAALLVDDSQEAQVGRATASSVAIACGADAIAKVNPYTAPLELFARALGGDFIGCLIGSLFGSHPSVGPSAVAVGRWNTGSNAFEIAGHSTDNAGTTERVEAMITTVDAVMTQLVGMIGGSVIGSIPNISITWSQNRSMYYVAFENDPNYQGYPFESAPAAIESAIIGWLRVIKLSNANPYMVYAAQHTISTTLQGLVFDLNSAHDFSQFVADPAAFDVSLALSNDPARLVTWRSELARVHQLGLDTLNAIQIADLKAYGTTAPMELVDGQWHFAYGMYNADGSAFALPGDVLATDPNLNGNGGHDFITFDWRVLEFAKDGTRLSAIQLNDNYGRRLGNVARTFLGQAEGLRRGMGMDILTVCVGNILDMFGFDLANPGQVIRGEILPSNGNHLALDIHTNTGPSCLIGMGCDYLGKGGTNLFVQNPNNSLALYECDVWGWVGEAAMLVSGGAARQTARARQMCGRLTVMDAETDDPCQEDGTELAVTVTGDGARVWFGSSQDGAFGWQGSPGRDATLNRLELQ